MGSCGLQERLSASYLDPLIDKPCLEGNSPPGIYICPHPIPRIKAKPKESAGHLLYHELSFDAWGSYQISHICLYGRTLRLRAEPHARWLSMSLVVCLASTYTKEYCLLLNCLRGHSITQISTKLRNSHWPRTSRNIGLAPLLLPLSETRPICTKNPLINSGSIVSSARLGSGILHDTDEPFAIRERLAHHSGSGQNDSDSATPFPSSNLTQTPNSFCGEIVKVSVA